MRQKRFYTVVGIFVVGALSLIIFGGVFFFQQYRHSKVETAVMFFKGSLQGLGSSTPVTYRGVKIGEVKLIEITENQAGNNVIIPVYVEFFVEKTLGFSKDPIRLLILNGFAAEITKPNFLTGIADIELVKATPPVHFTQTYFRGYPIYPTRNSVEKFTTLDDSLKAARIMFTDISQLIRSQELLQTINATHAMANSVDTFSRHLDQYAPSVVAYFNQSLKKISSAAESTQNLTDYLSRYPESLLRGKK